MSTGPARSRTRGGSLPSCPSPSAVVAGRSSAPRFRGSVVDRNLVDLLQELVVGLGLADLVTQQLHRGAGRQSVEHPAQTPDERQFFLLVEQLFLTRSRGPDVDGREDALLGELPVQTDL